jgi:hypothetical protein
VIPPALPDESPPKKDAAVVGGAKSRTDHYGGTIGHSVSDVKGIRSRSPEPPFCWQNKEALRKIREHLDGDSLLPYALSVYCALAENASDKGTEEFTTLQSHLAWLAGNLSTRTVQRVLPLLREVEVIDYETPRLRGPIVFRLLAVRPERPNVATNSPNVTTNKKTGILADNRNNKERTEKEHKKKHGNNSKITGIEKLIGKPGRVQL